MKPKQERQTMKTKQKQRSIKNNKRDKTKDRENKTTHNEAKQQTIKTKQTITTKPICKQELRSENCHEFKQNQQIVQIVIYTCPWLKTIRMSPKGRDMLSIQQQQKQHRKTKTIEQQEYETRKTSKTTQ